MMVVLPRPPTHATHTTAQPRALFLENKDFTPMLLAACHPPSEPSPAPPQKKQQKQQQPPTPQKQQNEQIKGKTTNSYSL